MTVTVEIAVDGELKREVEVSPIEATEEVSEAVHYLEDAEIVSIHLTETNEQ